MCENSKGDTSAFAIILHGIKVKSLPSCLSHGWPDLTCWGFGPIQCMLFADDSVVDATIKKGEH